MPGPPPRGAFIRPAIEVGGPPLYAAYGLVTYGVFQVLLSLAWLFMGVLSVVGVVAMVVSTGTSGPAEVYVVLCFMMVPMIGQIVGLAFGVVSTYGGRVMHRGGSANAVRVGALAAILGPLFGLGVAGLMVFTLSCFGLILMVPAAVLAVVGSIAGMIALFNMSELLTEEEPDLG